MPDEAPLLTDLLQQTERGSSILGNKATELSKSIDAQLLH